MGIVIILLAEAEVTIGRGNKTLRNCQHSAERESHRRDHGVKRKTSTGRA